ncbi:hypothetical protein C2S52_019253 [Perilla frutescens var. hirtella]|nr:hypothetical protein C2S52_019253 [Perilla frutescens var. hirtella]KAH6806455.1 hypothetical protein C2S51_031286 [Perilla frutescens var. frutescens]
MYLSMFVNMIIYMVAQRVSKRHGKELNYCRSSFFFFSGVPPPPNVLKKAQEEIANIVGFDRILQESDAPNLLYLQALIKETFRLHPPIPMLARKSIFDCVIDGYTIPANTLLFVNLWSMGRNHKIWDCPTAFRPERFLEKEKTAINVKRAAF